MPNQFLDISNIDEKLVEIKRDAPAQGLLFTSTDVCVKNVFGPMKLADTVQGLPPAKVGIRYYVHTVTMTAVNSAADAGNVCVITLAGETNYSCKLHLVPSVANAASCAFLLDMVMDENKAITESHTNVGAFFAIISYREVFADVI